MPGEARSSGAPKRGRSGAGGWHSPAQVGAPSRKPDARERRLRPPFGTTVTDRRRHDLDGARRHARGEFDEPDKAPDPSSPGAYEDVRRGSQSLESNVGLPTPDGVGVPGPDRSRCRVSYTDSHPRSMAGSRMSSKCSRSSHS